MLPGHLCLGSIMLILHSRVALEEVRTLCKVLPYLALKGGFVCLRFPFIDTLISSFAVWGNCCFFVICYGVWSKETPGSYGYLRYMVDENGVDDFLLSSSRLRSGI